MVPLCPGWALSSWFLVESQEGTSPALGGLGLDWAGRAPPLLSPFRVSWPRLRPLLEGQMGWDWTSWSWLPGPQSLSLPLKASPLWARGPLWGSLVGSSLALPLPLPLTEPLL